MAWHRINDKPFLLPRKSHTDTHTHTHTHICVWHQSSISSCASHNDGTDLAHIISHISSSSFLSNQINIFILHAKLFRTKYIWIVELLCVTSQICCPLVDDGSFCKWGMREIIGCWKIYRSRKGERQYIFLCITATEMSLWRNCHHWLHGSWNNDNFQCRQWRKFNQNTFLLQCIICFSYINTNAMPLILKEAWVVKCKFMLKIIIKFYPRRLKGPVKWRNILTQCRYRC